MGSHPTFVRLVLASLLAIGGPACIFSGTRSARKREAMSAAVKAHRAAVRNQDFATALAYDDQFLRAAGDPALRTERTDHFRQLLAQRLDKLGPVRDDNAEATVRTLIAFRREAARDLSVSAEHRSPIGDKDSATVRQQDLATIEGTVIAPALAAAAEPLWRQIEASAARGDHAHAVVLAHGATAELAPGNAFGPRLSALKARAAAAHLERANQAGERLAGARVLNARLATTYGAPVGALDEAGPALSAAALPNWTIVAAGKCGDSNDGAAARTLETQLRAEGYSSSSATPVTLTVTFESCPLTSQKTESKEEIFLRQELQSVPHYSESCSQTKTERVSEPGASGTNTVREYDRTTIGSCTGATSYTDEMVSIYDTQLTTHTVHTMTAKGTIAIAFEGGTRQQPFAIDAVSNEMLSWPTSEKREAQAPTDASAAQARQRLHDKVLSEIDDVTGQVLAAREAAYVAAPRTLEADHAFFVAAQLASTLSTEQVFAAMTSPVLAAALTRAPLPTIDLGATHAVRLPAVSIDAAFSAAEEIREVRGLLMMSLTGGVASASTTGGTDTSKGPIGSLALAIFPARGGFGFRISGGKADHTLMDIDFFAGYGFRLGWLSLNAIWGFGMDFTPGNQDFEAPTPNNFILPLGGYAEYGARIAYPASFGSLELMYTKAFRTSSALTCEKRGDVRFISHRAALTLRYAEYLTDVDGFFTPFSPDERIAKLFWVLGGVGF